MCVHCISVLNAAPTTCTQIAGDLKKKLRASEVDNVIFESLISFSQSTMCAQCDPLYKGDQQS